MRSFRQEIFDAIIAHSEDGICTLSNDEIAKYVGHKINHGTFANFWNDMERFGCIKVTREMVRNPINGRVLGTNRTIQILNTTIPKLPKKSYVVVGKNDIATTHPEVVHFLVNPEDARKYSHGQEAYVWVKCPVCGYERTIMVSELCNSGMNCPQCGDHTSYPNKYVRAFLCQLPLDYLEYEYHSKWTQGKLFDDFFIYQGKKYVVEVDGFQHHRDTQWSTKEWQQNNDKLKDMLARENGYEMIRIPCGRSRNYKIKETLLNSIFNEMFDLSHIDWKLCAKRAANNQMVEACEFFNKHQDMSLMELSDALHIDAETLVSYLKKGAQFDLCVYDGEERKNRIIKLRKAQGIKYERVLDYSVYDSECNLICKNMPFIKLADYMLDKYGVVFNRGSIAWAFKRQKSNRVYYKDYILERRMDVS